MLCALLLRIPTGMAQLTGKPGPSYRICHMAALDGCTSVERGENGRRTMALGDLSEVARTLGREDRPSLFTTV